MGGAVIESEVLEAASISDAAPPGGRPGVLMVKNLRQGGHLDWTPPGGVIDGGEALIGGLTREVNEETGLTVRRWEGPLYEITADAPDMGWRLHVEVHRAIEVVGVLRVGHDPDGIVVEVDVVPCGDCDDRMGDAHPWVREPLLDWMDQRWSGTREYAYRVLGADPGTIRVERADPHDFRGR